jgi:UDP-GlcNAc:undecaprenyl-phosphate GlcNAc-1-phosphate transferase
MLTPMARRVAIRYGLVDHPDGRRKAQKLPIPLAGGLAVLVSATLAMVIAVPLSPLAEQFAAHPLPLLGILAGSIVIALVGVADDYGKLRGRHKLLGQCVAVALVMSCGVVVHHVSIFGCGVDLGIWGVPFTGFLLLGAINSLNLIDGMDGLLSSVGVIVSLALAIMAALAGHGLVAGVALALAGGLLGFLRYNYPPAKIYLGDAGSMVVGLVLGTLAILSSLKAPATIALSAPLVLLTLPIFDTTAAILRRKLTGRSIYTTDRGHLHHCLLRRGLSVQGVLLLVCICCLLTDAAVLASQAFNNEWIALCTGIGVIASLVVTRLFGHAEVMLLRERLWALGSAVFGSRSREARQSAVRLQGSVDWNGLWESLKTIAVELNIHKLCLDVNAPALHEGYHARWDYPREESEAPSLWSAEIPLTARGQMVGRLEIAGQPDQQPVWSKIARLTEVAEAFGRSLDGAASVAAQEAPAAVARTEYQLAKAGIH